MQAVPRLVGEQFGAQAFDRSVRWEEEPPSPPVGCEQGPFLMFPRSSPPLLRLSFPFTYGKIVKRFLYLKPDVEFIFCADDKV